MDKRTPRVSIGVAVYNGEKYLAETLESLLAQTYTDFEVIISDNASTDRTAEICQRFAARDSRISYNRNPTNLGVAPNDNRVFHLSTGEYFKWADYDDVLRPDFLAVAVAVLDAEPDVVLCYPRVEIIDETSTVVDAHNPGPDTSARQPSARFHQLILKPQLAIQSMGLFRRTALERSELHGSYPSSDEVFLAELALGGRFYEIQERILKVRLHAQQSTRGAQAAQRARVTFFDTSLRGKIVLPKWTYLLACLSAIWRAPIPWSERARCYGTMVRWCLVPAHVRALGKDILLALRQLVLRPFAGPKLKHQQPT